APDPRQVTKPVQECRPCGTCNVFMAVDPGFAVAHGCTRLHTVAQFWRAVGGLLLGSHVKGWGGQRTTCVKRPDLASQASRPYWQRSYLVTLDFFCRSKCRRLLFLC